VCVRCECVCESVWSLVAEWFATWAVNRKVGSSSPSVGMMFSHHFPSNNVMVSLPISHLCGQAYDGASSMAGHLTGVAKRIQDDQSKALFVHCVAHCLNLCLQDCASKCCSVREALAITSELATLIRASPK